MVSIKELIDEDSSVEFADERIDSDLYNVSFSKSLRAIEGDKEREVEYREKNQWLKNIFAECDSIAALSGDRLKERLEKKGFIAQGFQSCDAFLLLNDKCRETEGVCHLMIEFKNVDRRTAIGFLYKGKDSVTEKCKGMSNMIRNQLFFFEEGDGEEILLNTHFALVYGGKATGVKAGPRDLVPKDINNKKNNVSWSNQRQRRAADMRTKGYDSPKADNEEFTRFANVIRNQGYTVVDKKYMNIGEPDFRKEKGREAKRDFTLMSASFPNMHSVIGNTE